MLRDTSFFVIVFRVLQSVPVFTIGETSEEENCVAREQQKIILEPNKNLNATFRRTIEVNVEQNGGSRLHINAFAKITDDSSRND